VGIAHPALSRWQKMNRSRSFQAIDWVVRRVEAKHLRQDALLETKVFYANASPYKRLLPSLIDIDSRLLEYSIDSSRNSLSGNYAKLGAGRLVWKGCEKFQQAVMAVPKKKTSKSKRDQRKAVWKRKAALSAQQALSLGKSVLNSPKENRSFRHPQDEVEEDEE
jgi:large subunit ribosomal protein L32